jgi:hypothetical protein
MKATFLNFLSRHTHTLFYLTLLFIAFILRLLFWTEHNFSETESIAFLKRKPVGGYILSLIQHRDIILPNWKNVIQTQSPYHQICFLMIFNEFSFWLTFKDIIFFFSFSANIIIASRLNSLVLEKYKLTDIIFPNDGILRKKQIKY